MPQESVRKAINSVGGNTFNGPTKVHEFPHKIIEIPGVLFGRRDLEDRLFGILFFEKLIGCGRGHGVTPKS